MAEVIDYGPDAATWRRRAEAAEARVARLVVLATKLGATEGRITQAHGDRLDVRRIQDEAEVGRPGDAEPEMPGRYVLVDLRSVVGNCVMFWREGCAGYTCELDEAHVFEEAEAFSQHRCCPDIDWPLPLDVARGLVVQHVGREAVFDDDGGDDDDCDGDEDGR